MNRFLAIVIFSALWVCGSPALYAELGQGTYKIDRSHSKVGFEIGHMVFSSVEGRFQDFSGTVTVGKKGPKVMIKVRTASINTDEMKRDKHLRSPDFFNVKKFPEMRFTSHKVTGNLNGKFKIHGTLDLHGVSRPLVLNATYLGEGKDPWGNMRFGFKATGNLNRKDYGLKWNKLTEIGPLVGNDLELSIKVELVKQ